MLKKTISYTDFDGNPQSDDFYFNLSKAEIAEWELTEDGGVQGLLTRITEKNDPKEIIGTFKDIIFKSYGVKSPDGKRFVKSKELSDEFASTAAYDAFFMELVTNADAAANFIRGIVPADIANGQPQDKPVVTVPLPQRTPGQAMEQVSSEMPDLRNMTLDEFQAWKAAQSK